MKNGYDQQYLKLMQGSELIGLVLLNMDHTVKSEFRAYMHHFSVKDRAHME